MSDKYRLRGEYIAFIVKQPMSVNETKAKPGDRIVFSEDGSVEVIGERDFLEKYEPVGAPWPFQCPPGIDWRPADGRPVFIR